jgi:ParB/RepB/Spo0J family partition protein
MSGPKTSPTKQPPPLILNTLPSKQNAQRKFRCADLINNPYNSRLIYTPETISERAASIKQSGLLTPILVTSRNGQLIVANGWTRKSAFDLLNQESPGEYDVIAGEFRPDMTDSELYEASYVTNEEHKLLTDYERAKHFKRGLDDGIYSSQEELTSRLLVDKSVVSRLLTIAELPPLIDATIKANATLLTYSIVTEALKLDVEKYEQQIADILQEYAEHKKTRAWVRAKIHHLLQLHASIVSKKKEPELIEATTGQIKWNPESKSRSIELMINTKEQQRDAVTLIHYLLDLSDDARKALMKQLIG